MIEKNLLHVVPVVGQPSETFIRRYCHDLLPAYSSVISICDPNDAWSVSNSSLSVYYKYCRSSIRRRVWARGRRFVGLDDTKLLSQNPIFANFFYEVLDRAQIDMVFTQYLDCGIKIHGLCQERDIRHVVRGHGYDIANVVLNSEWGARYRNRLNELDAILVPTPYQKERLIEVGVKPELIACHPCGVDVPVSVKKRSHHDGIRFLAVGRFTPKKAPHITLKSFLEAADEREDIFLTMVGDGDWLMEHCREILANSAHRDRVKFLGVQPNERVTDLMDQSHVFLQHSVTPKDTGDQEGAPVAITEAMAHGLPVVSTRHSGIPYLVDDGETGLLVDEYDVGGMKEAILTMAGNEEMRNEMARKGHTKAEEKLSWDSERECILELLGY